MLVRGRDLNRGVWNGESYSKYSPKYVALFYADNVAVNDLFLVAIRDAEPAADNITDTVCHLCVTDDAAYPDFYEGA